MKQSKRLLVGTAVVLYGLMILQTAASRVFMDGREGDPGAPARTTAEQLAALRDFTKIDLDSDFSVAVVQQSDYSVEVVGLAADRGDLYARVENGTLQIRGYGNPDEALVRIGMPALEQLGTGFSPLVSISGFSGDSLDVRVSSGSRIELRNDDIDDLRIVAFDVAELHVDQLTFNKGLAINGRLQLIPIE